MRTASLCLCLVGCGAGASGTTHDADGLLVEAELDADAPAVARHHLHLFISDESGAPVMDADIEARVEMPLHGHVSNETARVSELGAGEYDVFPVTFTMPGRWQVVVEVATDERSSRRAFAFEVE
jgi:hypothetical protein